MKCMIFQEMAKNKAYIQTRKTGPALVVVLLFFALSQAFSQSYPASPTNWLYPDGNPEGTRHVDRPSDLQTVDSFKVKWSTPDIAGDVKPLIGNIISNSKMLPRFIYGPNEMTAVIGGKVVVIDANGKMHPPANMPKYVKSVSVLFDTLSTLVNPNVSAPVIMGLETIEYENIDDSLSFAYICGHRRGPDTVAILKRLAIDLRPFAPNIFGSIRPVYGRRHDGSVQIYATLNMSKPVTGAGLPDPPFLRGLAQFDAGDFRATYPLPDVGDDTLCRITVGPEVAFAQPSLSLLAEEKNAILLPTFTGTGLSVQVGSYKLTTSTNSDVPYLLGFDITGDEIEEEITPYDLSNRIPEENTRPRIRPYYLHLNDVASEDSIFILLAEEYSGVDGSSGNARLHLCNSYGDMLTLPGDPLNPPFYGDNDHLWSIAVGNVDGAPGNAWTPYYPNNPGDEIIVTQSTREFAVASSKLFVMRYNSGDRIPKASPPNTTLNPFDTIVSQRINGWVAAVNDIDGQPNLKEEIFLVDGSILRVLRLRNYSSYEYRIGHPFDTVATYDFSKQTISNVAIADMEGDGLNDIIVTTYDSTYIIGTEITDILEVLQPIIEASPPTRYCGDETVELRWINYLLRDDKVDIRFRVYDRYQATDQLIDIALGVDNLVDTLNYAYDIDEKVIGYRGRFLVQSQRRPNKVLDSTALLSFENPSVYISAVSGNSFVAGETFSASGSAKCLQTVHLQFSPDAYVWDTYSTVQTEIGGDFDIEAEIPCMDLYDCTEPDEQATVYVRYIGETEGYIDTSASTTIQVSQKPFNVNVHQSNTICTNTRFTWDATDLDISCHKFSVLLSPDPSATFSAIDQVDASAGEYIWNIPVEAPDSMYVRLCCIESCMKQDMLVTNFRPNFINVVAPNPFNPNREVMEVVYQVPDEVTVTIRIMDQKNRLVAEPVKGQSRSPGLSYCDSWDGRIWDGSIGANGIYYLSLELSDGRREVHQVFLVKK